MLRILSLLVLLIGLFSSCTLPGTGEEKATVPKLVQDYYAAFAAKNPEALAVLFDPETEYGKPAAQAFFLAQLDQYKAVMDSWTYLGSYQGVNDTTTYYVTFQEWHGIDSTGKPVKFSLSMVFLVNSDGKIFDAQ